MVSLAQAWSAMVVTDRSKEIRLPAQSGETHRSAKAVPILQDRLEEKRATAIGVHTDCWNLCLSP
jgi:hypothetical protein